MLQSDWLVSEVSEEPDMLRSSPPADGQYDASGGAQRTSVLAYFEFLAASERVLPVLLRWDSILSRFSSSRVSWFSLSSELV